MYFTGAHYRSAGTDIDPEFVYSFFPGLKQTDYITGALMIGLAVFAIVVRMKLAGFKQGAPKMYLVFLAVSIVVSVGYLIAVSGIVGETTFDSNTIGQIVGSGVMIVVNYIYFKNRAHLFVNK